MSDDLPDGIHFNLDESIYHALPRLSASGVCNLLVSPGTFWASSWMNSQRDKDETPAMVIGRAYHIARLEPHRFAELYVRRVAPADFDVGTHKDIKEALRELGQPQTKGSGETVGEAALRLQKAGYEGSIYHLALDPEDDRIDLSAEVFDQIVTDVERLHQEPEVAKFLEGGEPEVSILWTDDKTGTRWKARLDYLAPEHIADLKTFDNRNNKRIDQCVADAVRFNRYYIPAVVYWRAVELVKKGALPVRGKRTAAQEVLSAELMRIEAPAEFWWVFQEKGPAANVLARIFRMTVDPHPHHLYQAPTEESREAFREKFTRPSMLFRKAEAEIAMAQSIFRDAMEIWGAEEPWGVLNPVDEIGDDDFAPFWLEE